MMTFCPCDSLHSPFHFVKTKLEIKNMLFFFNLYSIMETVEEAVVKSTGYGLDCLPVPALLSYESLDTF